MIDNIYSVVWFIEFREERRILLEVIGPELQSIYDDRQIEVNFSFYCLILLITPISLYTIFRLNL